MTDPRQRLGSEGEAAAELFLRRNRYTILARNFRCPSGEIDLIALDGTTVAFIEVKTRTQDRLGSPFDAVTRHKRDQIVRTARYFVARHRLHGHDLRFDVVGVWCEGSTFRCELVRHAFRL